MKQDLGFRCQTPIRSTKKIQPPKILSTNFFGPRKFFVRNFFRPKTLEGQKKSLCPEQILDHKIY